MKSINTTIVKYAWLLLFVMAVPAADVSALTIPENLGYDLTIADIKIGGLSVETTNQGPYVQIQSRGNSVDWVSLFYKVDDNAVSLLAKSRMKGLPKEFAFLPVSAKVTINEGPNKARKDFAFDFSKKVVTYTDILKQEKGIYPLKAATFDALSAIFYVRHLSLKPGTSVFMNIFNNKLVYKVEVQVLRRETVKASIGTVNTLVIRTNMNCVGDGIIYYPGDIYVWLTDDERRIPVAIEKKLNALIEGNLPEFVKKNIPDFLMRKLSSGSIKAILVKK